MSPKPSTQGVVKLARIRNIIATYCDDAADDDVEDVATDVGARNVTVALALRDRYVVCIVCVKLSTISFRYMYHVDVGKFRTYLFF